MTKKKEKTIWQIYGERGGQPPKFKSCIQLQEQIDEYFDFLVEFKQTPTITGLCLFLGFESRQSFYDYAKKPGFTYTIKNARMKIEHFYETLLQSNSATGSIFALKNMGWIDKTEVEQTVVKTKKQVFVIDGMTIDFDE